MFANEKENSNDKGFTLIEVIITVIILALVTAPFLSSFVSASKTNMKSKRVQEANELSQYVIEDFKASSIDNLVTKYSLISQNKAIAAGTTGYKKKSKDTYASVVKGNVIASTGFSKYYMADISLKPSKVSVNQDEAIPVIEKLDRESCLVLGDTLSRFDSGQTKARDITVVIDGEWEDANNRMIYTTTVTINTYRMPGEINQEFTKELKWKFYKIPSVYLLYTPLSTSDQIKVANRIDYDEVANKTGVSYDDLDSVNAYVINQKPDAPNSMHADNVKFADHNTYLIDPNTYYGLPKLYTNDESTVVYLDKIIIHSNVIDTDTNHNFTDANSSDHNDTVNSTIKMIKSNTVYELQVAIKYNGKKIGTYHASKIVD